MFRSHIWAELKCHSSCRLPGHPNYIWYQNGRNIQRKTSAFYSGHIYPEDTFSCAVEGDKDFPSPALLVLKQMGYGVTYSSTEICAFKGSTVDISYTHTYPSTVNDKDTKVVETFWLKGDEPVDSVYSGRVQFICGNNDCTLRITDLRESDSAEYKFRFTTNPSVWTNFRPTGVTLSVTDLQVQLDFSSIQSSESGEHYCEAENELGKSTSEEITIDVKYPEYSGRVQFICGNNDCTLRITDLRESDSAEYKFRFITNQEGGRYTGSPGVTLSVTVVHEQNDWGVTYSSTEICAFKESTVDISCSYTYPSRINNQDTKVLKTIWSKDGKIVNLKSDPEYSGRVQFICGNNHCTLRITDLRESDSAEYKFRFITNQEGGSYTGSPGVTLSVTDAPRVDPVSVSPSGEIEEGSSVTLTCSSDANPAANYTWYKRNENPNPHPLHEGPQLVFSSIQSSESGEYYCTAENKLGTKTSRKVPINVKYAPKVDPVSVSPSAERVEGSSVTLTCSSDANPAANYTWYKRNGNTNPHPLRKGPQLNFSSIQSSDSGEYYCTAENKLGKSTSEEISINVKYAPKLPSVSVSPSAEIVKGSSVTLTCSSDANPAANYTWYKENEDSPKASGQNFTITDIRAEHSGNYYCEAQNMIGHHNNTLDLIVVAGAGKRAAVVTIAVVLLAIVFLSVFLWIRKKRAAEESSDAEERPDNREQGQPEEQVELQYASIHFSNNQVDPIYSNIRGAQPLRHMEQQEVSEYAAVRLNRASPAPRKKKTLSSTTEPHECVETIELDSCPEYDNVSNFTAAQTEDTEQKEDTV
ncbi:B-cell receptor CD22-like [Symphorus nematophorus]